MFLETIKNNSKSQQSHNNLDAQPAHALLGLCSKRSLQLLNLIYHTHLNRGRVTFSLPTMARLLGVSSRTIQRCLKELYKHNLIFHVKRSYTSSRYYIKGHLLEPSMKEKILCYLRVSFFVCFSFLLSRTPLSGNVHVSNILNEDNRLVVNTVIGRSMVMTPHFLPKKEINGGNKTISYLPDLDTLHHEAQMVKKKLITRLDKAIPLSKHGVIKLQSFPIEALQEGLKVTEWCKGKEDPINALAAYLIKFCRERNFTIKRQEYDQRRHRLGISPDDDLVDRHRLQMRLNKDPQQEKRKYIVSSHMPWKAPAPKVVENKPVDESQLSSGAWSFWKILKAGGLVGS